MAESYELLGTHHVELCVGNAKQAAYYYQKAWGFELIGYRGLETGSREVVQYALRQDRIRLVLTSPLGPGGPINAFLDRHGDGVRTISLMTNDAEAAFASCLARGAKPLQPPRRIEDPSGWAIVAAIQAYGDLRYYFVQDSEYRGAFLPGFSAPQSPSVHEKSVGLKYIDHMVHNMPEGQMVPTVEWYQNVFGFHRFWSADDKDIRTEYSSLASIVVASSNERIKMPINEPAKGLRKSQIQEYLDYNGAPGVQHIALRTDNIIETVGQLRARGVEFLEVPDSYYEQLAARVGKVDEPLELLKKHRIQVDADQDGYLLQLFTKPVQDRPTLFFEIIERKGSESFGKGNFKALFEAIEREQARRGNL